MSCSPRPRRRVKPGKAAGTGRGEGGPQPVRNVTDPDSRLVPVRGGGLKQGYNCQDAAADDRLMLGGYACQDTGDVQQATRLEAVALKGAAVVAAAHAAHAGDPQQLAACHDRMCTSPARGEPGHDVAACHAMMTGGIGTIVYDAGYHSEENISAPGADRLIATGKRHAMDRDARGNPAEGPPPEDATPAQANDWRRAPPKDAPSTSAAPPTSRDCTPASKTASGAPLSRAADRRHRRTPADVHNPAPQTANSRTAATRGGAGKKGRGGRRRGKEGKRHRVAMSSGSDVRTVTGPGAAKAVALSIASIACR